MKFCLQCGSSLPPAAPSAPAAPTARPVPPAPPVSAAAPVPPATETAPPKPQHKDKATVPLKIAPTPVMGPRPGSASSHPRPSLGDPKAEIDEEALKKSFERRVAQPGTVVCRFCKGPLDLDGEFCEVCGAPVTEAAPPEALKDHPHPPPPPPEPAAPAEPRPAQATPPPHPPTPAATAHSPDPAHAIPGAHTEPTHPTPTRTPAPPAHTPPPAGPEEGHSSGLMGRLKGIFKKS